MLGRALGSAALPAGLALGVAGRDLLARPEVARGSLRVGVLVADPADRPGRAGRLVAGLRLGLDGAVDLDTSVSAVGAPPFGPALLDTAARLLDEGADVVMVTSEGLSGLVGPLCAARGVGLVVADEGDRVAHPWFLDGAQHRRGVLRRTERHWQEAYVLGQWAGRHLDGALFQLVTRHEDRGDGVAALRAGFRESGGSVSGTVEVRPKSAAVAAQVARASGARVVAVHATGIALVELVQALRAARVPAEIIVAGRGIDERDLAELGRGGPVYAASGWHRADLPELSRRLERGTGQRADACVALGYELASLLVAACRQGRMGDLRHPPELCEEVTMVVRRAASGKVAVVGRRTAPCDAPDLDAVALEPAIAALPHRG